MKHLPGVHNWEMLEELKLSERLSVGRGKLARIRLEARSSVGAASHCQLKMRVRLLSEVALRLAKGPRDLLEIYCVISKVREGLADSGSRPREIEWRALYEAT